MTQIMNADVLMAPGFAYSSLVEKRCWRLIGHDSPCSVTFQSQKPPSLRDHPSHATTPPEKSWV